MEKIFLTGSEKSNVPILNLIHYNLFEILSKMVIKGKAYGKKLIGSLFFRGINYKIQIFAGSIPKENY